MDQVKLKEVKMTNPKKISG